METITFHKPFNPASFVAADLKSRTVIIEYFKRKGITVEHNQDKYGIDLLCHSHKISIECEQRQIWTSDNYQYNTYHLPARKLKFFINNHSYTPYYCIINYDFTRAMIISRDKMLPYITNAKVQTVICQSDYKDSFIDIPISDFTQINLTN